MNHIKTKLKYAVLAAASALSSCTAWAETVAVYQNPHGILQLSDEPCAEVGQKYTLTVEAGTFYGCWGVSEDRSIVILIPEEGGMHRVPASLFQKPGRV